MEELFAAHIHDDGTIQTVKEHLEGAATKAGEFAARFGAGDYARICGILHDIGKYSDKFQRRIRGQRVHTDHSTAGAKEIKHLMHGVGYILSYIIAGHHAGLPDGGSPADTGDEPTLYGRLKKRTEPYGEYKQELNPEEWLPKVPPALRPIGKKQGFSISFFIRMLYSCLVDADFLDTEGFMKGSRQSVDVGIDILFERLEEYIKPFGNPTTQINSYRTDILHRCMDKAEWDRGLYTLTVPTGGGKTIASLAFAIQHAKKNGMDRVIYVIPYNSIIEQNAAVFKNILGAESVLEHHSNFAFNEADELSVKQKLATENWNMPVVVTTTVQFFESLFSNRPSHCRKLHNMANSVIIFDEAQMFPIFHLLPCIHSISELVWNYRSTVVLCSATQPALDKLFPKELMAKELCGDTVSFYNVFKRTQLIRVGELSDEELSRRLNEQKQALCIVGTRKQAQAVFNRLKGEGCYHLSTLMYPIHRRFVLKQVRDRLSKGQTCRVVSTSLIEAGVDVDFPVVYRAEAGLDSMIQAAGRCNREGKLGISPVYIFKPAEEYRRHLPALLKRPLSVLDSIATQYEDLSSPEAIHEYFHLLYDIEGDDGLDMNKTVKRFEDGAQKGMSFPFAQVAGEFRLIDNSTSTVIIPIDESVQSLMIQLKAGDNSREIMREIQQYSVNVYERHFESLCGTGSIQVLDNGLAVLVNMVKYSDETGLDCSMESGQCAFF